jgi:hypothetical protein
MAEPTGEFALTGRMTMARVSHSATLLADGRVLIAGGRTQWGAYYYQVAMTDTAEVYDPATGSFAATGKMLSPRYGHAAVRLGDGRVLIVGGMTAYAMPSHLAPAELYDPVTGSFTATGSTLQPMDGPSAVLLRDGRVLVADGVGAEIYDPAAGVFSAVPFPTDRASFVDLRVAGTLADGRVVLVGTVDNDVSAGLVFDPAGSTLAAGPSFAGSLVMATVVSDDRILAIAVSPGTAAWSAWYYRVGSAPVRSAAAPPTVCVASGGVARLANGRTMIAGQCIAGGASSEPLIFDPATNGFAEARGSMGAIVQLPTLTLLKDGRVLIVGGWIGALSQYNGVAGSEALISPIAELYTP